MYVNQPGVAGRIQSLYSWKFQRLTSDEGEKRPITAPAVLIVSRRRRVAQRIGNRLNLLTSTQWKISPRILSLSQAHVKRRRPDSCRATERRSCSRWGQPRVPCFFAHRQRTSHLTSDRGAAAGRTGMCLAKSSLISAQPLKPRSFRTGPSPCLGGWEYIRGCIMTFRYYSHTSVQSMDSIPISRSVKDVNSVLLRLSY